MPATSQIANSRVLIQADVIKLSFLSPPSIKYDWIAEEDFARSDGFRYTKIELVGGVLPSGFFCETFMMIVELQ